MAYSLNTDVTDEFKSLDTTGLITTAKIDEWISQSDEFIDGQIGLIYETPVSASATKSLKILKQISIGLVAQRIAFILETKSITPKGDQAIPKNLIEQAEKRIQMIVDRKLLLSDATQLSTHQGVKSFTNDNVVPRKFDIDIAQW